MSIVSIAKSAQRNDVNYLGSFCGAMAQSPSDAPWTNAAPSASVGILTVTTVLADFGLLLFLAQAGVKSGAVIIGAFTSGAWLAIMGLGALITLFVGLSTLYLQRWLFGIGGTRLSGIMAGTQSHPALLAYAQGRTGYDFRVSEGYTTVYAVSFLTKIVVGSLFAIFL